MLDNVTLQTVVRAIIEHQIAVIGPLAIYQANKVHGLKVDGNGSVLVQNTLIDPETLLNNLVGKFEELFGTTSVEVCKDAMKEIGSVVSKNELPQILQ